MPPAPSGPAAAVTRPPPAGASPGRVPDALEQRDAWRLGWRVMSSDALLGLVCAVVFVGYAGLAALPQAPAGGQQDAFAYSQWQARARDAGGPEYGLLLDLGLFDVSRAAWFRLAVGILGALSLVRLADRLRRLARPPSGLEDEARVRVAERALPLVALEARLRAAGYQIRGRGAGIPGDPDWVGADRGRLPFALSAVLHVGLAALALGAGLNAIRGWDLPRRPVEADVALALPAGAPISALGLMSADSQQGVAVIRLDGAPITLTAGGPPGGAQGVSAQLLEVMPRMRLTAVDAAGRPFTLTASSFAPPAASVVLALQPGDPEQAVLVERARLVVYVAPPSPSYPAGSVRAFGLPSGAAIGEWGIGPEINLGGAVARFEPLSGAIVSVRYAPGEPVTWLGALLAVLGFAGALTCPARRIVVRHGAIWTEYYAGGRGARRDVARLAATVGPEGGP